MSQKISIRRGALALSAFAACAVFSASAFAEFESSDPRLPCPRYDATSSVIYQTPGGMYAIDSFFDVFTEFSRSDAPLFGTPPVTSSYRLSQGFFDIFVECDFSSSQIQPPIHVAPDEIQCDISTVCVSDDGFTRMFDTEMLALNLAGGGFPPGVMIRESPTLQSTGQTRITDIGGGLYQIDSFFDVFTELSLDGGMSWSPSSGAMHLVAIPEPTTLALAGAAVMLLGRRQRRSI